MSSLKAHIYEMVAPNDLQLREESIDFDSIGSCEIIAETIVSVVSPGTEIAAYTGASPLRPMKMYPRVNGYCNVARVIALGDKVSGVRAGDRVLTHQSHRSAFKCHEKLVNVVLQSDDNATALAALPLWHLGYYPLLRANAVAGKNVAVIGMGSLGMAAVSCSRMAGCNVFALSNRKEAQRKAFEFGANDSLYKVDLDLVKRSLLEQTSGVGIDLVISTSNAWDDWKVALEVVRDGGDIAIVGFPGRGLPPAEFNPLDSRYIYDKELTIYTCGNPPTVDVMPRDLRFTLIRNYAFLADMLRRERLKSTLLISESVKWSELGNVYQRMSHREPGLLTVALQWQ